MSQRPSSTVPISKWPCIRRTSTAPCQQAAELRTRRGEVNYELKPVFSEAVMVAAVRDATLVAMVADVIG